MDHQVSKSHVAVNDLEPACEARLGRAIKWLKVLV